MKVEGIMCQAYEAERNFIIRGEHINTIKGFAAASNRKPKSANPHSKFSKYDREAWDNGRDCWHERFLLYALELKIKNGNIQEIQKKFAKNRALPRELKEELQYYLS